MTFSLAPDLLSQQKKEKQDDYESYYETLTYLGKEYFRKTKIFCVMGLIMDMSKAFCFPVQCFEKNET